VNIQPVVSADETQDDEIDLAQLVASLWAGKLWIAFFTFAALVFGVVAIVLTPPTYQADALLQLEQRSGQLALPDALRTLVSSDPGTEAEI